MRYGKTKSAAGKTIRQSPERDRRIAQWLTVFVVVASAATGAAAYFAGGSGEALSVAGIILLWGLLGVYIFKKIAPHL